AFFGADPGAWRLLGADSGAWRLLGADLGRAHDLRPLLDFGLDESGELLGSARDGFGALAGQAFAHVGRFGELRELGVEPLHDGTRRRCRREHAEPRCYD